MTGKTPRSISAPRENSSFDFRNKKIKLFRKIIFFPNKFYNYINLATHLPKLDRIALIQSAQLKFSQSIYRRCYVTLMHVSCSISGHRNPRQKVVPAAIVTASTDWNRTIDDDHDTPMRLNARGVSKILE